MKKVMMVVGVAACVTLVGCKHDEYGAHKIGNKVQPVETVEVASDVDPVTTPSVAADTAPANDTTGVPNSMAVPTDDEGKATTTVTTIPDAPVKDDAPAKDDGVKDVPAKDAPAKDVAAKDAGAKDAGAAKPAEEPEFTPYVVRGGDTLGGICYRYKVKKADVLALNPGMDPNKIFVGRTIRLPGNIEAIKSAPAPKADAAKKDVAKKDAGKKVENVKREYKPYTGETKEYVVKAGDTIGGIAYSNGLSIRQFKELNGLKSDVIRVGQKVKIPVEKVKSDKPVAVVTPKKDAVKTGPKVDETKIEEIKPVADKPAEDAAAADKPVAEAPVAADKPADGAAAADKPVAAEATPATPAEGAQPVAVEPPAGKYITYVVKPNDDLYSVAIKWSITASQLKEINNLVDETLTPGQELKVPATAD